MKSGILIALLVISSAATAEKSHNFSLGFGNTYGGLGIKYDLNSNANKYFFSLGAFGPIGIGYGVGWEHLINNGHHSLGVFAGTVAGAKNNLETTLYYGISANYSYYFSNYNESTWIIGLGVGKGTADNYKYHEKEVNTISINIGYQY